MEDVVKNEGIDYRAYKPESKKKIAKCAATACSIKAVLDTPLLSEDGSLTEQSLEIENRMNQLLYLA